MKILYAAAFLMNSCTDTIALEKPQEHHSKMWQEGTSFEEQVHHDMTILMKTLFSHKTKDLLSSKDLFHVGLRIPNYETYEKKEGEPLHKALQKDHQKRISFLKRWILSTVVSPLMKKTDDTSKESLWKDPLAVAFCHGGRIFFKNSGFEAKKLYNYLLTSKASLERTEKDFVIRRSAASHGIELTDKGLSEIKVKFNVVKNLYNGLKGRHHGLNVPIGGLGNLDSEGRIITYQGYRQDPLEKTIDPKIQHGHVYIYKESFDTEEESIVSGLLIGLESCAPGKKNAFGKSHNMLSGFKSSTEDPSITGGKKMKGLFQEFKKVPPQAYNGMIVHYTPKLFKKFQDISDAVLNLPEDQQKVLFKEILSVGSQEALKIIEKTLSK